MGNSSWDERIKRAEQLVEDCPYARDLLSFYREVLIFQKNLYASCSEKLNGLSPELDGSCPLHGGYLDSHLPLLLESFPSFLEVISRTGPADLSEFANELAGESPEEIASLLEAYWTKQLDPDGCSERPAILFFPKAFLQPYAELLAGKHAQEAEELGEQIAQGAEALCP